MMEGFGSIPAADAASIPGEGHDAAVLLHEHWDAFCDADRADIPEDFEESMEAAGLIEFASVTENDLDDAFAEERGIAPGGAIWRLTKAGRAALRATTNNPSSASEGVGT